MKLLVKPHIHRRQSGEAVPGGPRGPRLPGRPVNPGGPLKACVPV